MGSFCFIISVVYLVQSKTIMINLEELQKVELRVGTVLAAEPVAGSEKLLKLKIDLGTEQREILSGIAKYYSPEEIVDKQVVIVANLEPRQMMGMESQGMLLAASESEGRAVVLTVEKSVAPGSSIR